MRTRGSVAFLRSRCVCIDTTIDDKRIIYYLWTQLYSLITTDARSSIVYYSHCVFCSVLRSFETHFLNSPRSRLRIFIDIIYKWVQMCVFFFYYLAFHRRILFSLNVNNTMQIQCDTIVYKHTVFIRLNMRVIKLLE